MTDTPPISCSHQPACHDPATVTYTAGTPGNGYWHGGACDRHARALYAQAARRGRVREKVIRDAPPPAQTSLF